MIEYAAVQELGDHPRSRGVYMRPRTVSVTLAGSSPLARGLPRFFRCLLPQTGIIPARAGFTRIIT